MKVALTLVTLMLGLVSSCPDKDPYCAFCNGVVCIYCIASFPNSLGKCQPSKSVVDNCLAYKSDGVCRGCKFGYELNENKCLKISIPNCYESVDGVCSFCENRFLQIGGKCDSGKTCSDSNCQLCKVTGSVEVCGLCLPGYALLVTNNTSYKCIQENDSNRNCLRVFNEDISKCAVCDINFFWRNAQCQKTDAYYIDYQQQQQQSSTSGSFVQKILGWLFGSK
jgi:hypothetical protein